VRRVLKENPGTYNAPRTDDELEERKGERERERERERDSRGYVEKKRN